MFDYQIDQNYENKVFRFAVISGLTMHLLIITALVISGQHPISSPLIPLAVMDFADYDPLGGSGEGGAAEGANTPAEPEPEPELVTEPKPPLPDMEDLKVVESISEKAVPVPLPAPIVEKKPNPKPKPKPKPKPASSQPSEGNNSEQESTLTPGSGGLGAGGIGGGTGRGNSNALNAYTSKIRQKLERNKKYPQAAQSKGINGVVTVSFIVTRDGTVNSAKLIKSSGHQILDDEAMALLKRVSPLPPIPDNVSNLTVNLQVPLRFSIR